MLAAGFMTRKEMIAQAARRIGSMAALVVGSEKEIADALGGVTVAKDIAGAAGAGVPDFVDQGGAQHFTQERSGDSPTRRATPHSTASGRSVFSRSTIIGLPSAVASS
jgi:hypothetical protein